MNLHHPAITFLMLPLAFAGIAMSQQSAAAPEASNASPAASQAAASQAKPGETRTGSLTVPLRCEEPITAVWLIQRNLKDTGLHSQPIPGQLRDNLASFSKLPVPGRYDLRIQTASGLVEGWDATLAPLKDEDDDEQNTPKGLDSESLKTILKKMERDSVSGFDDRVQLLDISAHRRYAALLITKLRTRAFVGGNYQPGEWVWRVERWQWESADGQTWVPVQEQPFYALVRQRLSEQAYRALHVAYSRKLGGIILTPEQSDKTLDVIQVPKPMAGIVAVDAHGKPLPVTSIKPADNSTDRLSKPSIRPPGEEP